MPKIKQRKGQTLKSSSKYLKQRAKVKKEKKKKNQMRKRYNSATSVIKYL